MKQELIKAFRRLEDKKLIGLTGAIAAGKSTALRCFGEEGAGIISADKLNGECLTDEAICDKIILRFGDELKLSDGLLNLKLLSGKVFSSVEDKTWLESVLHPEILKRAYSLAKKSNNQIIVIEMPLLFEAGLESIFDISVCLVSDEKTLIERAAGRGWTKEEYRARAAAQFGIREKMRRADIIIENSGTEKDLSLKIKKFCGLIKAAGR